MFEYTSAGNEIQEPEVFDDNDPAVCITSFIVLALY